MVKPINFPFERDKIYAVEAIDSFLQTIMDARQLNPALSAEERARGVPWAKLWWEELYPVKLYIDRNPQRSFQQFRIMPEGHATDVELHSATGVIRVQITTAYPEWSAASNEPRTGGYKRSLEREGLNQGVPVFTGRQIWKNPDGKVVSEPDARPPEIDQEAWRLGLSAAIERKLSKARRYTGAADHLGHLRSKAPVRYY